MKACSKLPAPTPAGWSRMRPSVSLQTASLQSALARFESEREGASGPERPRASSGTATARRAAAAPMRSTRGRVRRRTSTSTPAAVINAKPTDRVPASHTYASAPAATRSVRRSATRRCAQPGVTASRTTTARPANWTAMLTLPRVAERWSPPGSQDRRSKPANWARPRPTTIEPGRQRRRSQRPQPQPRPPEVPEGREPDRDEGGPRRQRLDCPGEAVTQAPEDDGQRDRSPGWPRPDDDRWEASAPTQRSARRGARLRPGRPSRYHLVGVNGSARPGQTTSGTRRNEATTRPSDTGSPRPRRPTRAMPAPSIGHTKRG